MTPSPRRRRERGVVRGCCLLILVLLGLLGAGAYLADRALAAPELGAAPQGPDHGDTQVAIAVSLGTQLAAELLAQQHGAVTLSERDLTVLAQAHTNPQSLSGVTVRVRNRLIVVSGGHQAGPFMVTPVAHLSLTFVSSASPPQLTTQVTELDVGELPLPGFLRDRVLGGLASPIDVDSLFGSSQPLQLLRSNLECAVVVTTGVRLGVHRPGSAADPGVCGS